MLVHVLVGQERALLCLRIHTYWRAIDDDVILLNHLGGDSLILDGTRSLVSTDEHRFQTQIAQPVVDGLRGTACTQNKGFLVPLLVEHGFYALRETYHVRVVAFQLDVITFMRDANDIDSTNGTGFRRHAVEERYDLFLVRYRHIQTT